MEGAEAEIEPSSPEDSLLSLQLTRKKRGKNKRRFSDEQVRSLETIFVSETKLEPRKKVQVARELGLQPRQVAIWFQNKRARWKSKQTEKNYRVLKASYESLKSRFESMEKEKESLLEQMQELKNLIEVNHRGGEGRKTIEGECLNLGKESRGQVVEASATEQSSSFKGELSDHQAVMNSDDDKSGNIAYLMTSEDQPEHLSISGHIESSLMPPAKWCSFDSDCLYDQPLNCSQWWESLT